MNNSNTDIKNIQTEERKIWSLLQEVTDPEIPVLSILDLGIVRDVKINNDIAEITITPTYSGCPAMDMISMNIKMHLLLNGFKNIKIISVLSPAWTTDWMTEEGKEKLRGYGIEAPGRRSDRLSLTDNLTDIITCPQCHSINTKLLSQFGSTACKALYQCNDCREPFDYFKCH